MCSKIVRFRTYHCTHRIYARFHVDEKTTYNNKTWVVETKQNGLETRNGGITRLALECELEEQRHRDSVSSYQLSHYVRNNIKNKKSVNAHTIRHIPISMDLLFSLHLSKSLCALINSFRISFSAGKVTLYRACKTLFSNPPIA